MSKFRTKQTILKDQKKTAHSQLVSISHSHKGGLQESSCRKSAKKQRCVSVKTPSQVSSFNTSKPSSQKCKLKNKKKAVLFLSQHQTPVLGKYFTVETHQVKEAEREKTSFIASEIYKQSLPNCDQSSMANTIQQQQAHVKAPLSNHNIQSVPKALRLITPSELNQTMDATIDKLRSKQQTIEVLNKTIHTRLVDAASAKDQPKNYRCREDAYEVEMNFYVQKITELQKSLHQKTRQLGQYRLHQEEFDMLSRNNRKLIQENIRLKESAELSTREVAALRKLLMKARSSVS